MWREWIQSHFNTFTQCCFFWASGFLNAAWGHTILKALARSDAKVIMVICKLTHPLRFIYLALTIIVHKCEEFTKFMLSQPISFLTGVVSQIVEFDRKIRSDMIRCEKMVRQRIFKTFSHNTRRRSIVWNIKKVRFLRLLTSQRFDKIQCCWNYAKNWRSIWRRFNKIGELAGQNCHTYLHLRTVLYLEVKMDRIHTLPWHPHGISSSNQS